MVYYKSRDDTSQHDLPMLALRARMDQADPGTAETLRSLQGDELGYTSGQVADGQADEERVVGIRFSLFHYGLEVPLHRRAWICQRS